MKKDFNNSNSKEQAQNEQAPEAAPKAASEHDSMFGSLLFEAFCGTALLDLATEAMDAPEWAGDLDWSNAAECYSEFQRDRTNGGFKLGVNKTINGEFNSFGIAGNDNYNDNHKDYNSDMGPGTPSLLDPEITASRGQGSFATAPSPFAA